MKRLGLLDLLIKVLRALRLHRVAFRGYEKMEAMSHRRSENEFTQAQTDGLPIPPPDLIVLVAGTPDVKWFLDFGKSAFQIIADTLEKNNVRVEGLHAVLDFGCGCGRLFRHWHSIQGPEMFGVDCNAKLIEWCQKNLPFGTFLVSNSNPPLPHADGIFDFIYATSVFTHMSEELQLLWMKEFSRLLRPRGYLIFTTHGVGSCQSLTKKERQEFDAGHLVVKNDDANGTNLCNAYHPESYVRSRMTVGYTIRDFTPAGTRNSLYQDMYLMTKDSTDGVGCTLL